MRRILPVVALASAALLLSTGDALAYLDPGMGSLLLQGLVAAVAAVSVFSSRYWAKIKSLFKSSHPPQHPGPDPDRQ